VAAAGAPQALSRRPPNRFVRMTDLEVCYTLVNSETEPGEGRRSWRIRQAALYCPTTCWSAAPGAPPATTGEPVLLRRFREAKYLLAAVPKEFGGHGLSLAEICCGRLSSLPRNTIASKVPSGWSTGQWTSLGDAECSRPTSSNDSTAMPAAAGSTPANAMM